MAKSKNPATRAELIRAVSEILNQNTSSRESELVADVLIDLLTQAERDLRHALAEKLSEMQNVPLRLILQLANDEIDIATPILTNSNILGTYDLIYIIKSKTPEYWQTIAKRKNLAEQVIDTLADTGDFGTAVVLAENMDIKLTEHAVLVLSDLAQESEVLARPLLRREEVPQDVAAKLYNCVSQELKNYIFENYDLQIDQERRIIKTIDNLALEFVENYPEDELLPMDYMLDDARKLKKHGHLNIKKILTTLKRGHYRVFTAEFAVFTDLDSKTIAEIIRQHNGQGLAVACKAFVIPKQDFISLFLLTNRLREHGKTADLGDMTKAISYYDRIKPDMAVKILRDSVRH